MRKIIWWWNMVYYFSVKWYTKVGDIVTYPLYKLFNTSLLRKWSYKKRGVEYDEKIVKNAVKQAQIAETYMRLFLSIFPIMPMFALLLITDTILNVYCKYEGSCFFHVSMAIAIFLIIFPLQNYLLGKDDRYKKYFKEFDNMFKTNKIKRRLYGFMSFLTLVILFITFFMGFFVSDKIRLG